MNEATQGTLKQLAIEAPYLTLAVIHLSVLGCLVVPLRWGDQASLEPLEALFAKHDLQIVEFSTSVVELATQLRVIRGLRTHDALHPASSRQLGPEAVMIMSDAGFQRVEALQVCLIAGA